MGDSPFNPGTWFSAISNPLGPEKDAASVLSPVGQAIGNIQNKKNPPVNPNDAAANAADQQALPRGRAATILTGGAGLADNSYGGARRTLLGN